MRAPIFLLLSLFSSLAIGQISISATYVHNDDDGFALHFADVQPTLDPGSIMGSGIEASIGYWMRFTKVRMEFIPAVQLLRINEDHYSSWMIGVQVNALIYPMDFYSDCGTCPTFSKDGGLLKKGFHWIIAPGYTMISGDQKENELDPPLSDPDNATVYADLGAGLDIGVSNLLTITPFVSYRYGLSGQELATDNVQSLRQIHFGLRTTLRFDEDRW